MKIARAVTISMEVLASRLPSPLHIMELVSMLGGRLYHIPWGLVSLDALGGHNVNESHQCQLEHRVLRDFVLVWVSWMPCMSIYSWNFVLSFSILTFHSHSCPLAL